MDMTPSESDNPSNETFDLLTGLFGEEIREYLPIDKSIEAIKQCEPGWQAPCIIGLFLLFSCYIERNKLTGQAIKSSSVDMMFIIWMEIITNNTNFKVDSIIDSSLEPLQNSYKSLTSGILDTQLCDELLKKLFYVRFALGLVLLYRGETERAKIMLTEMFDTKTEITSEYSQKGLSYIDIRLPEIFAAIVIQDCYCMEKEYEFALRISKEVIISNSQYGYVDDFSENLILVYSDLLDSFCNKCEEENDYSDWVDLLDYSAGIVEFCGEADVSSSLPSECKKTSPQFYAWKFGQIVARFALRNKSYMKKGNNVLPDGYRDSKAMQTSIFGAGGYGDDWLNGTVVASLLLEYEEHWDWQFMTRQYNIMWEALPRYQFTCLCEASPNTDLYWAIKIGFSDWLSNKSANIYYSPSETTKLSIIQDIETIKDITSSTSIRQIKGQWTNEETNEITRQIRDMILEQRDNQPNSKNVIKQKLEKYLRQIWELLPCKVIDNLVKAEGYYITGTETDNSKIWFNKAVEATIFDTFEEPLIKYVEKLPNKEIGLCVDLYKYEKKKYHEIEKIPLIQWSNLFYILSFSDEDSQNSLKTSELRKFINNNYTALSKPALKQLSKSLADFCQRKDSGHFHSPRAEAEIKELEEMRDFALGTGQRPSVIVQIYQLFKLKK
jgi:hypothetical protein